MVTEEERTEGMKNRGMRKRNMTLDVLACVSATDYAKSFAPEILHLFP